MCGTSRCQCSEEPRMPRYYFRSRRLLEIQTFFYRVKNFSILVNLSRGTDAQSRPHRKSLDIYRVSQFRSGWALYFNQAKTNSAMTHGPGLSVKVRRNEQLWQTPDIGNTFELSFSLYNSK